MTVNGGIAGQENSANHSNRHERKIAFAIAVVGAFFILSFIAAEVILSAIEHDFGKCDQI